MQVSYCCMDGSSNNRAFMKMHFEGHPMISKYTAPNPYDPDHDIVFIMDPSVSTFQAFASVVMDKASEASDQ